MPKEEIKIIEVDACTKVDEIIVKQAREFLESEGRSDMARMFKIFLDHYEKNSGKVIHVFEFS